MPKQEQYIAIDLKSFYASAECVLRNLDPLTTNLVVADLSRTEKTICLAVSPSLKAYGIPGRPRLFEVVEKVGQINALRRGQARGHQLVGKSTDAPTLARNPDMEVDYIVATPRMAWYMECSAKIFQIYCQFVAPEDIHIYSVDEVFIYATPYLRSRTAQEFAAQMMQAVLDATGITATAGIGTNLFLCKVAMDVVAKHIPPDHNGMRMATLDEISYRKLLWDHQPITDIWRVGRGTANRLAKLGIHTMGDIARCSLGSDGDLWNENRLYKTFGINAELLIDHAWGYEPCRMEHIKAYKPENNSVSTGQVLSEPYPFEKARLIAREMADELALGLTAQGLITDLLTLTVAFDRETLADAAYQGPTVTDHYGRQVPKPAHGSHRLPRATASGKQITAGIMEIFDRTVGRGMLIRKLTIAAAVHRADDEAPQAFTQLNLFDPAPEEAPPDDTRDILRQKTMLDIKRRFGKNAILKGMNFQEGATARERNAQVGGHRA